MPTRSDTSGSATLTHTPDAERDAPYDLAFDAFFGGAFGGSAIALFFLIVDSIQAQPLYTPSLLGIVLFTDTAASAATDVRIDMVAYFTIVHFVVFGTGAALLSTLTRRFEPLDRNPLLLAGTALALLTLGLLVGDAVAMPGVVAAIGIVPILAANAVAGLTMAALLRWAHRPGK
jgi:hypothetical protein